MHAAFPLLLTLSLFTHAISLDCGKVVANDARWDLSALGGPHTVHALERVGASDNVRNTTYTIDICRALKKEGPDFCGAGTRICAQTRLYQPSDYDSHTEPRVEEVWSVAGEFAHNSGRHLDPIPRRLKSSESSDDSKKEGVRIILNGGLQEGVPGLKDVKVRAYVEFICDRDRSGLEGPERKAEPRKRRSRREEDDGEEGGDDEDDGDDTEPDDREALPNPDKGASLQFEGYSIDQEKSMNIGTLRLEWRTRHACEDAIDSPDSDDDTGSGSKTGGWGFFTWFIIIFFLATAAYLIFGSWMNYSQHGARGWDLLPHGDTIRDVPYLLKDWARRVFSSSSGSGGGSRDLGYIRV